MKRKLEDVKTKSKTKHTTPRREFLASSEDISQNRFESFSTVIETYNKKMTRVYIHELVQNECNFSRILQHILCPSVYSAYLSM